MMFFDVFRKKQRILIIDDENAGNQLAQGLKQEGFEATASAREDQISPLLVSFRPDAIVVGISFPDLEGISYLRKLRSLRVKQPIIVLSDIPSPDTEILARVYGAARYQIRPFPAQRVANLIRTVSTEHETVSRVFPATQEEAQLFHSADEKLRALGNLDAMANPRSIMIVGASETPGKAAERRTRSLIEGGFSGDLFPVNPKRETIFGYKAYPTIADVPAEEVDLAVIIVARHQIVEAVRGCCEKKAKGIIVITAGLGESDAEGKAIEDEILALAAKSGSRIVGPNCSGMFSGTAAVNLLGVPGLKAGPFSVIAQSGNVIDSLCYYAAIRNTGFSKIFSAGNAIGFSLHHYIEFLSNDPETKVIMMYLEGIREGVQFIEACRAATIRKPVVVIKVGNSEAGMRAAASHTASIASSSEIVSIALKQAGVIRANNVDELFDLAEGLAYCPIPKGNRVAILSEGGGDNAIAAENVDLCGLRIPLFSKELQERIRPILLPGMPAHNPIDYGGVAEEDPIRIAKVTEQCFASEEVHSVLVTGFFGGFREIISESVAEGENETARKLIELVHKYEKPLVVHSSFARAASESLEILKRNNVPVYESCGRSARVLAAANEYSSYRRKFQDQKPLEFEAFDADRIARADAIIQKARSEERTSLLETEAREILEIHGLPVCEATLAESLEDVFECCQRYDFPLAMKIVSPDILHKSDIGGVKLNLRNEGEAFAAYKEILEAAKRETSADRILGVLVAPMVASGPECIVGMLRDPFFGPVLMFGMGGVLVEAMKDISFRVFPLFERDIVELIQAPLGYKLLKGYRGKPPSDTAALEKIVERVALLAHMHLDIMEIDLNPTVALADGAAILDARIIIR